MIHYLSSAPSLKALPTFSPTPKYAFPNGSKLMGFADAFFHRLICFFIPDRSLRSESSVHGILKGITHLCSLDQATHLHFSINAGLFTHLQLLCHNLGCFLNLWHIFAFSLFGNPYTYLFGFLGIPVFAPVSESVFQALAAEPAHHC